MSKTEWQSVWVKTLIDVGIEPEQAYEAFAVCYGNQEIDLSQDPANCAKYLLPPEDANHK